MGDQDKFSYIYARAMKKRIDGLTIKVSLYSHQWKRISVHIKQQCQWYVKKKRKVLCNVVSLVNDRMEWLRFHLCVGYNISKAIKQHVLILYRSYLCMEFAFVLLINRERRPNSTTVCSSAYPDHLITSPTLKLFNPSIRQHI